MLPDFPIKKQPHPFGCLPTCVQAVLCFYEDNVSYEEVSEWCRELPGVGCFWSEAVTGLIGQGYEVEEVTAGGEEGAIISAPTDIFFKKWQYRDLQAFRILRE